MKNRTQIYLMILVISLLTLNVLGVQRFPKPEFGSGYITPEVQITSPRSVLLQYLDLIIFLIDMTVITWLIVKKRSRRGVFWLSVFSLLYFGFYRKGCICPVGSLQNVTLAIFDHTYNIPLLAILFFIVPIGFTLFYGRTFCAGVCPLGAIQDIFVIKPLSLKPWIRYLLGILPFLYLGLAVLYAATGTDFIICRYDPFVEFFRHNGSFMMFAIGGALLLIGVFIARPYCRFFCPYGALLNLVSRVSNKHISIAPGKCVNCRLCEHSCPFDAIDKPTGLGPKSDNRELVKKLIIYCLVTPALVVLCGWTLSRFHENLALVNFNVRLAQELIIQNSGNNTEALSTELSTFLSSGTAPEALFSEAASIIDKFRTGSWIVGAFIGLVLGITLARLTIFRFKNEYNTNKGNCYSCARCLEYCPVKE